MSSSKFILIGHKQELILMAIANLDKTYGMEIVKFIKENGWPYKTIKDGTIYATLRELESKRWIKRVNSPKENKRQDKVYYSLTKNGRKIVNELTVIYSKFLRLDA